MLLAQSLGLLGDGVGGALELVDGRLDVVFVDGLDFREIMQLRELVDVAALVEGGVSGESALL